MLFSACCKLYVTRENALELREDEYYFADLAGLTVQTEEGNVLGTVKDILQTGANDVYVVSRENQKELPGVIYRLCLHHHTCAAAKRSVVGLFMSVRGIISDKR